MLNFCVSILMVSRASQVAQWVKNLCAMQEMLVWSLRREDPLEEGMAVHSSILAWRITWTEEPGGPQSMGLQGVWHNWSDLACTHKPDVEHYTFIKHLIFSFSSSSSWSIFLFAMLLHRCQIFHCKQSRTLLLWPFLISASWFILVSSYKLNPRLGECSML